MPSARQVLRALPAELRGKLEDVGMTGEVSADVAVLRFL